MSETGNKGHMGKKRCRIVILGASYARGWQPREPGNFEYVNLGVDGQESGEMLSRFDNEVIPARPDAVVIWGFINDIFRTDLSRFPAALAQTRSNIAEMTERAKRNGIRPVLATEVTIRGKSGWRESVASLVGGLRGKKSYQERVNDHVRTGNRWIREYAAREQILMVDFESALSDAGGARRREFATEDGSHISAEGYRALDRAWLAVADILATVNRPQEH